MTKLTPCPFCGVAPTPIDETNFPGDFEHPWEHKGCWLDGVPIRNTTAWNRREQLGQQAAASGVERLQAENAQLRLAISWALGESPAGIPEFMPPEGKHPPYWWRKQLRALAVAPPPVRSGK